MDGFSGKEIAAKLFISNRTVYGHFANIRDSLGYTTLSQMAKIYLTEIKQNELLTKHK